MIKQEKWLLVSDLAGKIIKTNSESVIFRLLPFFKYANGKKLDEVFVSTLGARISVEDSFFQFQKQNTLQIECFLAQSFIKECARIEGFPDGKLELVLEPGKNKDEIHIFEKSFYSKDENIGSIVGDWSEGAKCNLNSIAEAQNWLEDVLREGRIALWGWNPSTAEILCMKNLSCLLGYPDRELEFRFWDENPYIHKDDQKSVLKRLNEHLMGDIPYFSVDFRAKHFKGNFVWLHCQGKVSEFDEVGNPIKMSGILQDISEKVEMDSQLRQSQKMEAIGSLAGGIAHDFNNLLQVIMGYAEIAKDKFSDIGEIDEINNILEAGEKSMMLVKQLLSFSRSQDLKFELINLSVLIPALMKLLRSVLGDGINLNIGKFAPELMIYGDPVQLEQILVNLCINSRDAMLGEGQIEFNLEEKFVNEEILTVNGYIPIGDYVVLTVEDNGCGIPADYIDRVFEPFFTTKDVGRGTGLGLSMVYAILKRHSAYVILESEHKKGTSFKMFFPEKKNVKNIEKAPVVDQKTDSTALVGKNVLVAEDDKMVRQLVLRTLNSAGCNVIEATNGAEAVELFKENSEQIDLLILDMIMPEMNGRDVYDNISKIKSGVPVLFASGYSSDLLETEYMLKIPGILLQKPYQKNALIKSIVELIG